MLLDSNIVNDLTPAELKLAAGYFSVRNLEKRSVIFKEGDAGTFMCLVCAGTVGISKSKHIEQDDESLKLALLHKGRTFGEMAVLDGERRSATCTAITDCTLLVLSKESIDKMIVEAPRVAAKLIRSMAVLLSRRLRMTTGKLAEHDL